MNASMGRRMDKQMEWLARDAPNEEKVKQRTPLAVSEYGPIGVQNGIGIRKKYPSMWLLDSVAIHLSPLNKEF